ncbi:hypothetical protein ACHAWX_004677 [Stephanocyclus meneghinianus]
MGSPATGTPPMISATATSFLVALALFSNHSSPFLRVHADVATSNKIVSSFSEFPYDENNHLASHILAYPATEPCNTLIAKQIENRELYHHIPIAVDGEVASALFPSLPTQVAQISDCPAVCLDRGVDYELVPYPMPEKYYDPRKNEEHSSFPQFLGSTSCGRVEIAILNYSPKNLDLYWYDEANQKEVFLYPLERMEKNTRFIHTYVGHRFRARDPDSGELIMDEVVEFTGSFGVGNHVNPHRNRDIREQVKRTMDGEWMKKSMVKRTFSPLGFDKGRLPKDLYGNMRSFYYNNRNYPHLLMEEWDSKGVYVNYWETDCNFIMIPWTPKKWWQMRLLDVVQQWAGVEIEQTDLYGMRQYTSGARLLTHVDRINTHAVSLIVNVAQGNVTAPWTVEVYDHANRLHEVVMEPGDIVYYESAKALHGRNTPLAGGFYTNLFTHYRPTGDPHWYEKENPPGTPEPIIDVGKCELVGKPDEYSVGAVKCENHAIGPHLSPKMFTAKSGEDLYNLWLSVGPSFDDTPVAVEENSFATHEEEDEEDESEEDEDDESEEDEDDEDDEEYHEEDDEEVEGHDEF